MALRPFLLAALLCGPLGALALDLDPLWDFGNPALSEQRFRAALAGSNTDDALILQTQIARTYGLRRDFARAQAILAAVEPQMAAAGAEARVRYALELGRTLASATHPPASQTAASRERARAAFLQAATLARPRSSMDWRWTHCT